MWTRNICIAVGLIAWSCLVATVAFKTGKEKAFNKCDAWIEAVKALEKQAESKLSFSDEKLSHERDRRAQFPSAVRSTEVSQERFEEMLNEAEPSPPPLAYGDGYGDIAPPTASTHFSSPGPIVIEGDSTATGRSHRPTYLEQLNSARSTEISPARANWPRRTTIENSSTDYGN